MNGLKPNVDLDINYNYILQNDIINDIDTMLCPIENNSNTIELTVHTSFYFGLRLTLCY